MKTRVSEIFVKRPGFWGLRGDPYLWDDLQQYFSSLFIPLSEDYFRKEFETVFENFTGGKIYSTEFINVPQYNHGGMSGGMVSPEFWSKTALPLLIERLSLLNQEANE